MNSFSPAVPQDAPSRPSWMQIPALAGALLWRHWPALLFWFLAQRVAYDLLLGASIWLAETSVLLSYAAIALLVVTQLIGVIAVFLVLRPSLPCAGAPAPGPGLAPQGCQGEGAVFDALAHP